jgi:hypothetical protein
VEGVVIEAVLAGQSNSAAPVIQMSKPDYGLCVMPIGKKHKGELVHGYPAVLSALHDGLNPWKS